MKKVENEQTEIEKAQELIKKDKAERVSLFAQELESLMKKHNIRLEIAGNFKGQKMESTIMIEAN